MFKLKMLSKYDQELEKYQVDVHEPRDVDIDIFRLMC